MNKNMIIGLVVIVLVAIGAGYFLLQSQNMQSQNTAPSATPVGNAAGGIEQTAFDSDTVEVTVESRGLSFTPNEIRVKRGQTVKLTYKNTMGNHDWVIDEFNAGTPLVGAGEEATVTFVADQAGTFEYYCSVPGHREAGMKGNLIVE